VDDVGSPNVVETFSIRFMIVVVEVLALVDIVDVVELVAPSVKVEFVDSTEVEDVLVVAFTEGVLSSSPGTRD